MSQTSDHSVLSTAIRSPCRGQPALRQATVQSIGASADQVAAARVRVSRPRHRGQCLHSPRGFAGERARDQLAGLLEPERAQAMALGVPDTEVRLS
jgi:hypothetical protein